jgi:hypothetical protein
MTGGSIEISCPACSADALLRREATYDGFKKTGERLFCAACGHQFASEQDVPFKLKSKPSVFSAADLPKIINIFQGDEQGRNCRHCTHYVVNPFIQRCTLCRREVQATDLCADFCAKPAEEEEGEEEATQRRSRQDAGPAGAAMMQEIIGGQ